MLGGLSRSPYAAGTSHVTLRDTSVVPCPLSCSSPSPLLPLVAFPRSLLGVCLGFYGGRGAVRRGRG